MPASAVAAPPSAESVEPPDKSSQLAENWGDGMDWKQMDHMTRLRFLTPRVIETGRPSRPDTGFFECLPQAVKDPLSAKREAQMETARISDIKDIKAFFKKYRKVQVVP